MWNINLHYNVRSPSGDMDGGGNDVWPRITISCPRDNKRVATRYLFLWPRDNDCCHSHPSLLLNIKTGYNSLYWRVIISITPKLKAACRQPPRYRYKLTISWARYSNAWPHCYFFHPCHHGASVLALCYWVCNCYPSMAYCIYSSMEPPW